MKMRLLADHNIEWQASLLWNAFVADGWQELLELELVTFAEVGLHIESNDRVVWKFAQANNMLLLTANRNMDGEDSLEQTIREENTLTSLPVLTIGTVDRMIERSYRERCVLQLAEIIADLDLHLGRRRIYLP